MSQTESNWRVRKRTFHNSRVSWYAAPKPDTCISGPTAAIDTLHKQADFHIGQQKTKTTATSLPDGGRSMRVRLAAFDQL